MKIINAVAGHDGTLADRESVGKSNGQTSIFFGRRESFTAFDQAAAVGLAQMVDRQARQGDAAAVIHRNRLHKAVHHQGDAVGFHSGALMTVQTQADGERKIGTEHLVLRILSVLAENGRLHGLPGQRAGKRIDAGRNHNGGARLLSGGVKEALQPFPVILNVFFCKVNHASLPPLGIFVYRLWASFDSTPEKAGRSISRPCSQAALRFHINRGPCPAAAVQPPSSAPAESLR